MDNFNIGLEEVTKAKEEELASLRHQVACLETRVQRLEASRAQGEEGQGEAGSPEGPAAPAGGVELLGRAYGQLSSQAATGTHAQRGAGAERQASGAPAASVNLSDSPAASSGAQAPTSTDADLSSAVDESLVEQVKSGALPATDAALSDIMYVRVLQRGSGLDKLQILGELRSLIGDKTYLRKAQTVRASAPRPAPTASDEIAGNHVEIKLCVFTCTSR